MWLGTLDLHETLAANWLIAAPSVVEIRWVCEEADGALGRIFVQENLERLPVHKRILRKLDFLRC